LLQCTTPERHKQIDDFLKKHGWARAKRSFLAGDASARRYERVMESKRSAVLMDADIEREDIEQFIKVDELLCDWGFSAPAILAQDLPNGLLLLEDFGNESFTHLLTNVPQQEVLLYKKACESLMHLQRQEVDGVDIPAYHHKMLLEEVQLFTDWYLPAMLGEEKASLYRESFMNVWKKLLDSMPYLPPVLVLRDFHADNLMWLPQREGIKQVGFLDFQDAVLGSPAYDLVSFIEDARRDIQPENAQLVLNQYLQQMAWDRSDFMAAYAILGAQRNCKILGIFTRLAQRDGKMRYLDYIPRVWRYLEGDLHHGAVKPFRDWLAKALPKKKRTIPTQLQRMAG
jgi:hypothetical protein